MVTVTCPNCGDQFQVVIPDELIEAQKERESTEDSTAKEETVSFDGEVVSWDVVEDPQDPYSGNPDERYDIAQQIRADIRINGQVIQYDIWYTPHKQNWKYFKYVVRGETDAGQKSLNVYDSTQGLFVKNRAVPWTTDKQWTYLQPEELERRGDIAELGEVIEDEEGEGGHGILIDMEEQSLIEEGSLNKEFIITLAKTHLVMWSRENPAA